MVYVHCPCKKAGKYYDTYFISARALFHCKGATVVYACAVERRHGGCPVCTYWGALKCGKSPTLAVTPRAGMEQSFGRIPHVPHGNEPLEVSNTSIGARVHHVEVVVVPHHSENG